MKAGEFDDGEYVLRAKIDMASPNINMRDPTIYRIRKVSHHRTGDKWCIYPMYDFTHCLSDSIEGITHSLCDLGFENQRPLYDWVLDELKVNCHPQQIEFSRLNLQYTMMSKRKLKKLVDDGIVDGWDDPRMPTISGLRRRGYTAESIRDFCRRIGVTKNDNNVELAFHPLKVVIENYPIDRIEELTAANHPKDETMGNRIVPFTREVYIDRADFREQANRKYKRLVTGGEVRLRYGYVIRCERVVKDENGEITELICSYDPDTLGKNPQGRNVRGVIHWVSAEQSIPEEVRLFEPLFNIPVPDAEGEDYEQQINPDSRIVREARLELSLAAAEPDQRFQFEREGYFCLDEMDSKPESMVFNRILGLRDSWAKIEQKSGNQN
jgi:glutaminyl-tRNA synthetase